MHCSCGGVAVHMVDCRDDDVAPLHYYQCGRCGRIYDRHIDPDWRPAKKKNQ